MISKLFRVFGPDPVGKSLAEVGSFYGHLRGKLALANNFLQLKKTHSFLSGKKILLLGTGPSSAAIAKNFIDQYDYVVLLNLAVKYTPVLLTFGKTGEQLGFFCCDRNRILEASPWLKLHKLPRYNCVFFPDYPYSALRFDLSRVPAVLLCGLKGFRKAYVRDDAAGTQGWHYLYTDTPIDEAIITRKYNAYMNQHGFPPYIPYSVAFSAITFYSFFRPSLIHMLGCDFTGPFVVEPMDETFQFVRSLLESFNIPLENISSTQLRMIRGV